MSDPSDAFQKFLSEFVPQPGVANEEGLHETADFGANPGNLRMLSYAPAALAPGAPLVVVLHGCTQTASGYARGAGWFDLADRYGFAVLCPEQRGENNANRCFNWFQPDDVARGGGEAASIHAMIQHTIAAHALDPKRVFVTGLSAGGAMACALLATYPETFAAGAIVAGLPYGAAGNLQQALGAMMQGRKRAPEEWGGYVRAASTHVGPWPKISIWHGDSDRTVVAGNAASLAAQWTDVHAGAAQTIIDEKRGQRTYSAWDVGGQRVVELHILAGLDHGAPILLTGPDPVGAAGPFLLSADVSSSAEITAFWGIAQAPIAKRVRAPAKEKKSAILPVLAAATPEKVLHARQSKKQPLDIGAVIKKALTAAGLMRN